MRRRRWLWVAGATAVILGSGAAAARPWLRSRVETLASARLGLACHVRSLRPGFSQVTVEGLRCGDAEHGVQLEAQEIVVTPGPLALAFGGREAIRSVRASDVELGLDVDASGFAGWLEDRRGGGTAAATSGGQTERPRVEVSGVVTTLRDAQGELGSARLSHAEMDASGALRARGDLALGERGAGELSLEDVSIGATRGAGARGATLTVVRGHVVAPAAQEDEEGPRTLSRCLAVARRFGLLASEPPEGSPADGEGEAVDGSVAGHIDAGLERLTQGEEATELDEISTGSDHGREARWVEALRHGWSALARGGAALAGARLSLESFEIRVSRPTTDRVVVRELTAGFAFEPDAIHLEGHGVADTGGALSWDLTLDPGAARGEGTIAASELPLDLFSPLMRSVPVTHAERGRLSLNLRLQSAAEELELEGDLTVRNAELTSPSVAAHPVRGLALAAAGRATYDPAGRRVTLEEVRLTEGNASVALTGSLEASADHYAATLRATLPPTACADALGAIPRDLLDDVADFSLEGRIAARVDLRLDSRDLEHTRLGVHVADGCRFVSVPGIADLRRVQGPFVHRVLEPDGSVFEMDTGPGTDAWTPIGSISPFLVHAVVSHEDGAFFRHSGFAPWAIRDALVRDLEAGSYVTGASTISMQLAKNLFLRREKTLARKAQEVILTWWLEAARSKSEILELYLNLIEYGPGIYGIRAAANHYFGREPAALSAAEAVFLASILPAPKRFHAEYIAGELSHSMAARMRRQLARLADRGQIDAIALADGLSEIDDFRFARPGVPIPHVALGTAAALGWSTEADAPDDLGDADDLGGSMSDADYGPDFDTGEPSEP